MNRSSYDKNIQKNKCNKNLLAKQIHPHILQINPVKHKSFIVNKKMHNTLAKKHNYNKYERSEQNSKTKNKIMINHRPSISTDFSLSLEFGNIMINNKPKNNNNSNLNNLQINKNRLIKVNTKRNNYAHTLSIRDEQNNTNKKIDKNLKINNIERSELFQNISEINIFQNMRKEKEKEKIIIDELNNEQYKCNMNKIIHIQKWWKNIFIIKKKIINSLNILIKIIKKFVLYISYNSIKNAFPKINYFFYKWHNKMIKRIILNQILNNGFQIQKVKKINKEKQNILNDSKKNKNIHNNKKKIITININNDNSKKKETNNNYCQTTKHNNIILNNNKINFHANYLNNPKYVPYSPKVTLKNERFLSPMNPLKQKINKKTLSKRAKKNNSKLFKNEVTINEKKQNQINTKKILNKISERKNNKKKNGENIIHQKKISALDHIISNNTSKNDLKSFYGEHKSVLLRNPNSKFNSYIINFTKKEGVGSTLFHNYKKENNDNKNKLIDDNFNPNTHNKNNNKSQYFNTEANTKIIDNIFKNKDNKLNSKIYENCLFKDNKYKNFCSQEKIKLQTDIINNTNNENIVKKKSNNIPINKYVILHKKEKEKKIINKEFSNHKININNYNSINNSNTPLIKTSANCSRISSIDNNSVREKNIFVRNLGVSIFFNFWKEYVDKKIILLKFTKISKFIKLINHHQRKILIKEFMQKLLLLRKTKKKETLYGFFIKMIFKIILNLMTEINKYKKQNMKEIKILKKDIYNNIYSHFHKKEGDIINNINIKNYINYDEYKLHKKRKARSPGLLSKIIEFKTANTNSNININPNINTNSNNEYNQNMRLTLSNSNTDKYFDIYKQSINRDDYNKDDEDEEKIYIQNEEEENEINIEDINNDSTEILSTKILNNFKKNEENGVIVDQINQLKMVINLLERHNHKKDISSISSPPNSLMDCFNKWKSISLEKNKALLNKMKTPRINEKIINLKPFQTSQKMNIINPINPINPIDLSLKKNFSLNKMSPKIINVINVQNFNENNNYNYNFKYMPIKDIPIYPNKNRQSYGFKSNIDINNINTDFNNIVNNNNINENTFNINKCNNNLDISSFLLGNDNKRNNIIYHKKKLGSTPMNNNYHFNYNTNLDNWINKTKISNCNYTLEKGNSNYDNSSLLLFDPNLSQIILNNQIYTMKDINMNTVAAMGDNQENTYNEIRQTMYREQYPEEKYGFKKTNQIEEKEINFDNINNNNNKKLYIKKQCYEPKKEEINLGLQNNIKTNLFDNDINNINNNNKKSENENINKNDNNLIKCLNIQFAKTSKELFNNERLYRNNLINTKNNCITISEDTFNKYAINDNKKEICKNKTKGQTYNVDIGNDNDNDNNNEDSIFDNEYIERIHKSCKRINKISKNMFGFDFDFDYIEEIKNEKNNNSFELYPKEYERFKKVNLYSNNINVTL